MHKGRIIWIIGGNFKIYDLQTKQIIQATPRGVMKHQGSYLKVGDIVSYEIIEDNKAIITEVDKRKNDLIRPFIANIDQAFVIFSVKEPSLNLNLLDKFLVNLEYNDITPIIIFSKYDLLTNSEIEEVEQVKSYYESIGYKVIKTSTKDNSIEVLKDLFKDKISVFTGQSGVGKSSLLNVLDHTLNLETNEISNALNRGKHTTRHVELIPIYEGMVADTPGFGTIDFYNYEKIDIAHNFKEFFIQSSKCKYNGCLHLDEPECMVKKCVQDNLILKSRYENYLNFINEVGKDKRNDNSPFNPKLKKRRTLR